MGNKPILTLDLMMLLVNLTLTISAWGFISQRVENANLSSPPRREHRLELSRSGTMSILYTEIREKKESVKL